MSRASRRLRKSRNKKVSAADTARKGKAEQQMEMRKMEEAKMQAGTAPAGTIEHMQEKFDNDDFLGVLQDLTELIEDKCYDPKALYLGAYSYFMQGDYVRAAALVNDALQFAPQDVEARILLARICMLEDRSDDGLAIFDFVLEHYANQLTTDQHDDVEDILDYYAQNDPEHIAKDFPHIAAFMHVDVATVDGASQTGVGSDIEDAVIAESEPVNQAEEPVTSAETVAEPLANGTDIEAEVEQVMAADIALAAKVRLLNNFAGAHYAAGDLEAAQQELKQALTIDGQSATTIRNMAVLLKDQGKADLAWQVAARLPETDFLLLAYLKK